MLHSKKLLPPLAAFLAAFPAVAMAGTASAAEAPGRLAETEYGPMLVTATGMSLYISSGDDAAKGTSECTSDPGPTTMPDPTSGLGKYNLVGYKFVKSCLDVWKPYEAPANAVANGDWSIFNRPGGRTQWAWQGKPLYLSVRDKAPGDKNGVNPDFGGAGPPARTGGGPRRVVGPAFRFAGYAPFPRLPMDMRIVRDGGALVLANANEKPLYTLRAGARLQHACAGCAELQPVEVASIARLKGEWSMVNAGAGRQQIAWNGKPLFFPSPDQTREDIARAGYEPVVYRQLPPPPSEIGIRMTMAGNVYTDKAGKTLYTFVCTMQGCDLPGGAAAAMSALCSTGEECMRRWRPALARGGARASGEWSVIDVPQPMFNSPDGLLYPAGAHTVKAWAYRGRPVFTYFMDKGPGDIWGNTVRWFNGPPSFQAVRVPHP